MPFFEIDRIAFLVLLLGVGGRMLLARQRLLVIEPATWPMIALTLLATASVAAQPADTQAWSLLAAKYFVPFALFHVAGMVFKREKNFRHFETFALFVLAYLGFTAVCFLVGAKSLIFPRFILDSTLGYHADRARGPFLQAVANGVSLNLLGVLAMHAFLRRRIRGLWAGVLLASLPAAILATMTRAVWLWFLASVGALLFRFPDRRLRRCVLAGIVASALGLLFALSVESERRALTERFQESGPVGFRMAVYTGGWEMFREKPLTGWGEEQMPTELAHHVSGYQEKEMYPHNTYLELLVEHGILGVALYVWLMWEIYCLGRGQIPSGEREGWLGVQFHSMWPVLLGIYWVNANLVVMNYQFVNGLLFTMAGMLAAQRRRAAAEMKCCAGPLPFAYRRFSA